MSKALPSGSVLIALLLAGMLATWGCGSPISGSLRREIDRRLSFQRLRENPESYRGRLVLVGGEIIETRNRKDGTWIEVLQRELGRRDRPKDGETTEGRFLVLVDRFLDPVVYHQGRKITVAGTVLGGRTAKIGEVEYLYPVIRAREIHLWEQRSTSTYVYPAPVWLYWDF